MNYLIDGMKKAAAKRCKADSDEFEEFKYFYDKWKFKGASDSYERIPRFFRIGDSTSRKLTEEAKEELVKYQASKLLDQDQDVRELCEILEKVLRISDSLDSNGLQDDEKQFSLDYEEFKTIIENSSQTLREYFKPSLIFHLMRDKVERKVAAEDIVSYIKKKSWIQRCKIGLFNYATNGHGFLSEVDLQNYVAGLIPTLPGVSHLSSGFLPFYICGAVSKFVFFLDPSKTGKMKVNDILVSTFLDEILELRDENLSEEALDKNWFSAISASRVYGQFVYLDTDKNGTLSKEEFANFGSGTLTRIFIDRVYQECLTFEGEMDYRTYLDIVLALENRNEPQSLRYLFRLLDVDKKGYLDAFSLNYMFRGIQELIFEAGQEPASFEDIECQIVDIVKPADPNKITLNDLIACEQGETIVNILIEVNGYYAKH